MRTISHEWRSDQHLILLILGKLSMNQILEDEVILQEIIFLTKKMYNKSRPKLSRNYHKMLKQQLNLKMEKSIIFHNNIFYLYNDRNEMYFCWRNDTQTKMMGESGKLTFVVWKLAEFNNISPVCKILIIWNSFCNQNWNINNKTDCNQIHLFQFQHWWMENGSCRTQLLFHTRKGREISISHARKNIYKQVERYK